MRDGAILNQKRYKQPELKQRQLDDRRIILVQFQFYVKAIEWNQEVKKG